MRIFVPALALVLITSAFTTSAAGHRKSRGPWVQWGLIVPGERFGEFHLGDNIADTLKKLAKPDAVDYGETQTRQVWKWGEDELFFVQTTNNPNSKVDYGEDANIDLIRFSYPGASTYRTSNQVSTGSTLEEVKTKFPNAQPLAGAPMVYDDVKQGIAFEFGKGSTCIAIMVHAPGRSEFATQAQVEELLKKGTAR